MLKTQTEDCAGAAELIRIACDLICKRQYTIPNAIACSTCRIVNETSLNECLGDALETFEAGVAKCPPE